jgi:hypothetical protein
MPKVLILTGDAAETLEVFSWRPTSRSPTSSHPGTWTLSRPVAALLSTSATSLTRSGSSGIS